MKLSMSDRFIIACKEQGYVATSCGIIYSPSGKIVPMHKMPHSGHVRFTAYASGVNQRGHATILSHRFIAYFFYGHKIFKHDLIRHLNDIPDDNRIDNLMYGSHQDNRDDIPRSKISIPAIKHAHKLIERSRKLSDEDVREIRKIRATGVPYYKIAPLFDVTTMTIYRACSKDSWKNVN